MTMTFENVMPWLRRRALEQLTTAEFLEHETEIRVIDWHWDWLCNQLRAERGLAVILARNYNFTAIAWWTR